MLKRTLLFSSASFAGFVATAQQLPVHPTIEPDSVVVEKKDTIKKYNELSLVEVRSIRAPKNSPFARTDLSKQDIVKQNLGQDVPVLLQFTPSAVTTSDAGTGIGYTGLRIRGTDPTRINVTFNGMPVNDPEEQATFFVDIPDIASSTSSIQVQRGVGTSTNGAGAFGGTVSISNLQQMDSAGIMYSTGYGSFNTFKNTLIAGSGMLKGGFQFDVRLSKLTSDGYIQRSAADLKAMQFTAGWTPNDRTSVHFMFMPGTEKTGQAWNGVMQDSVKTNRTYNELGMRSDGSFYNDQTDNYLQNYFQLFADHRFANHLSLHTGLFLTRGKGYYQEYKTGQYYSDYYLPNVVSPTGADTLTSTDLIRRLWLDNYYYGGVFSLAYTAEKTVLTLGGGWNQFQNLSYGNVLWAQNGGVPDGYKWYQLDAQKNDANIYIKAQHTIGGLTLFGDVQYRNVSYYMNGFRKNPGIRYAVDYNFFNPKAGASYSYSKGNVVNRTYASFAIGNREPGRSAFEAAPGKLPKPERLMDYELGNELAIRHFSAGVNLYYMDYKDQLILTGQINDVGAYTPTNVAKSYRAGIELMAGYEFTSWLKLYGNLTLSQNKIKDFTEFIDNYDSSAQRAVYHGTTDISFSPNAVSAVTLSVIPVRKGAHTFSIDLTWKYVGKQYLDNTGNNSRSIDAYNFANAIMRYTVKTKTFKEITASLALYNIYNTMYSNNGYTFSYIYGGDLSTTNYYYPQAGFNVLAGLMFRL